MQMRQKKYDVIECMEKCKTGKNGWDLCTDGDTLGRNMNEHSIGETVEYNSIGTLKCVIQHQELVEVFFKMFNIFSERGN